MKPRATDPISRIEQGLDHLWSQIIHLRDKCCQKCGGHLDLQPHHVHERTHKAVRWLVENGSLLCRNCHRFLHDHPVVHEGWARTELGPGEYDRLATLCRPVHVTLTWLEETKVRLQQQLGEVRGKA